MGQSFASRMTRCPDAYDRGRGGDAAARLGDLPAELRALVAGAAGCSPYLTRLVGAEPDWIAGALAGDPDAAVEAELSRLRDADTDLWTLLRQGKRRIALLVALADLAGVWPLETVTAVLTRLADLAVERALAAAVAREAARGRVPGGAGLVAFAMGKMGAHELNYSSDIDLIVLFDESLHGADDAVGVRAGFVRATREAMQTLSATRGGYVFRTDLRLRPDPSTTPICLSMGAAERYYESAGRTWERAAWIKARPAAGDARAGETFLARIAPFVWRRHLDFWAIRDAQDMRARIRREKGVRPILEGFDLKLGPGGIREIEFYTQTRQIILGGRAPDLRPRGTVAALRRLEAAGWAPDAAELVAAYAAHRELEHRVQMIDDLQTHRLPADAAGFDRLAAFCGTASAALRQAVAERTARVAAITEDFFVPAPRRAAPDLGAALGPALGAEAEAIVARWPGYPALRSERAVEIFERVKPELLRRLGRAADPVEALAHLDRFLAGLPAGVQVFSLFDANPQLVDLIVDIASTSPDLALHLSRHAAVFEAVIDGDFFAPWPGVAALAGDLAGLLGRAPDYEARLVEARRWRNEWHFRVGVHLLRGIVGAEEAGAQYAELAEAVLRALWPAVVADHAGRHGAEPGQGAAVVAMGSLGAASLGPTSDLDLLLIYDAGGAESSDGPRPLPVRTYYARLTQALITALSANLGPGRLYEVDMRLRPSGRKGPVATSLASFSGYQRGDAWTWEHMALTRARAVAGSAAVAEAVDAVRAEVLAAPRERAAVLADVAAMRARLAQERPGRGRWDATHGAGRMQEIALLAQAGALIAAAGVRDVAAQLAEGAGALGLTASDRTALTGAYRRLWAVRTTLRLLGGEGAEPDALGLGGIAVLCREGGAAGVTELEARLAAETAAAAAVIGRVLGDG